MILSKHKSTLFILFLLFGLIYFSTVSIFPIDDLWKSQVALIPIQLGSAIYMTYLRMMR